MSCRRRNVNKDVSVASTEIGKLRRLENSKELHNSGSELPVDVSKNPLKLCKG